MNSVTNSNWFFKWNTYLCIYSYCTALMLKQSSLISPRIRKKNNRRSCFVRGRATKRNGENILSLTMHIVLFGGELVTYFVDI